MSEPERAEVVDVGACVDQVMAGLVAAGFEDEDDPRSGSGRLDVHEGDGRL
jgi:hypothetical protein